LVLAAGLALAGCDKCGNSIFQSSSGPQSCRGQAPQ
jgi:hypothetical protein